MWDTETILSECKLVPPWIDLKSYITLVSIAEGATSICGSAFAYSKVESIELPLTLQEIAPYAFNETWGLTDVYYPGTPEAFGQINIGRDEYEVRPFANADIQ